MSKKEKKEIPMSRHHLLPQSQWWANIARNIELIRDVNHRAIHTLFENKMIAEQLLTTVDISSKALRPDVKEWLIEVLTSKDINDPYERYDSRVIK